jgi:hypothetical protein
MTRTFVGLLLAGLMGTSFADTLLIEAVDAEAASTIQRPARGASMTSVEARFGAPSERRAAIGEPPITRWEYPGFTVFFEHEYVIHAVARR